MLISAIHAIILQWPSLITSHRGWDRTEKTSNVLSAKIFCHQPSSSNEIHTFVPIKRIRSIGKGSKKTMARPIPVYMPSHTNWRFLYRLISPSLSSFILQYRTSGCLLLSELNCLRYISIQQLQLLPKRKPQETQPGMIVYNITNLCKQPDPIYTWEISYIAR